MHIRGLTSSVGSLTRKATLLAAASAVAVTAAVALAGPASARPANYTSSSGAYNSVSPAHGLASASTTFKVPTIYCLTSGEGQYIGILGSGGGAYDYAVVETSCAGSGDPVYQILVSTDSGAFYEPVSPGDTVAASMYQTTNWTQATVHDLTTNYTWVADSTIAGMGTVTIGATTDGYTYAPQYTSVVFTKTQVNGDYLGYQSPTTYNWYRGSTLLASTGAIVGGDQFKVVFHND